MKKSELIEAWLNSEISEDEAILILERMKHDENFNQEMVDLSEIHACLYTIYHEDQSFEELKLNQQSLSPDDMEDQIMDLIAQGEPKEREKKKRITVVDLPQNVTVKTKSFDQPRNVWPIVGGIAAVLAIIFTIVALSGKQPEDVIAGDDKSDAKNEKISLVKTRDKPKQKPVKKQVVKVPKEKQKNSPVLKVEDIPEKVIVKKVETTEKAVQPEIEKVSLTEVGQLLEDSDYSTVVRAGENLEVNKGFKFFNGDEFSTSYESQAQIILQDNSSILVEPSTTLIFKDGAVRVKEGKAEFEVKKQKQGTFIVHSGETLTTVVGTSFTVNYLNKVSNVRVNHGKVKVSSNGEDVFLEKDQMSISKDGQPPKKHTISEQYGIVAGQWKKDQIGPQVGYLEFDVSNFIISKGFFDFYFKKLDDESKGMLQVFKAELYEDDRVISVDEHHGVTSNHTTDLRNRNVWLHGGYGSSMYRFYLGKVDTNKKYKLRVRCRSFKGSCDGQVWLLHTVPDSETLIPGAIPSGNNLAYRKKVSTEKPGFTQNHGPEKIVDNKITPQSSWWGAGSKWVQIDLGKEQEFNSMFIANFWEQNCYHQFFVEVSADGQKWQKVIDMTENTLPAHETGQFHKFSSTKARYIRMTVDSVKFSQGGISVVELKVFNSH